MTDRYGNTRVAKIRAAYNDMRAAIRAGDIEAVERALDRYEPWADYVFGAPKIKPLVWNDTGYGYSGERYSAETILGWEYVCLWDDRAMTWSGFIAGVWKDHGDEGGLEAAKAAAQADYERRILSALEGYDD